MPATWIELPQDCDRWNAFRLDRIVAVIDNEGSHEEGDFTFCSRIVLDAERFDPIIDGYIAARATDVLRFIIAAASSNEQLLRYDGPRTQASDLIKNIELADSGR